MSSADLQHSYVPGFLRIPQKPAQVLTSRKDLFPQDYTFRSVCDQLDSTTVVTPRAALTKHAKELPELHPTLIVRN